jgi:hypothetical protein
MIYLKSIENKISNILRNYPFLRSLIKFIYKYIFSIYNFKNIPINNNFLLTKMENTFFGYYDKFPENISSTYLIYHKLDGTKIHIILRNLITDSEQKIDELGTFNLQIGARLMWLNDYEFIYNSIYNDLLISKIYNINTREYIINKFPIFDSHFDKIFISLDFKSLFKVNKDYGYNILSLIPDQVTIFNKNNEIFDYISYDTIINFDNSLVNPTIFIHEINHIMISPDGSNFIFIHRWYNKRGVRNGRLLIYNIKNKLLKCLIKDCMISHFNWYDNNNLIGYFFNKLNGDNYYFLNINNLEIKLVFECNLHFSDGHPSIFNNNLVFDTYPNKYGFQYLNTFNLKSKQIFNHLKIKHPIIFNDYYRCDLHPRIRYNTIYFDYYCNNIRTLQKIII